MKLILVILVVTVIVVAVTGLPVNPSPSADYPSALESSKKIQTLILTLESHVISIVYEENSEISDIIRGKVHEPIREVDGIMNNLNSALIDETMTAERAKDIIVHVTDLLAICLEIIQNDLLELSQETNDNIFQYFFNQLVLGDYYSNELYDYLICG